MDGTDRYITKIEIDLSAWTEHYPTGCILYHYDQMIDSAYCDNADEFIEFIEEYKASLLPGVTDVRFVFDGYDLDNPTAMDCAKEVWEAANELIHK